MANTIVPTAAECRRDMLLTGLALSGTGVVAVVEAMHGRTRTGEETSQQLGGVANDLLENAESLREEVDRFQI